MEPIGEYVCTEYEIEPADLELECKIGAGCTAEVYLGRYGGNWLTSESAWPTI